MSRLRSRLVLVLLLPLLSFAAALPSSSSAALLLPRAVDSNAPTTEATSDGSGSTPYLHSPSFLLFSLESLLIGLFLLLYGHRGWRATTALGTGLLLEFVVWVIVANTLPAGGFSSASRDDTGIIVWALVSAGGIVGLFVGAVWWRVGVFATGACGGLALGLGIDMMGDNALPPVARWVILGVLSGAGLLLLPLLTSSVGMIISTSLTGSFLLFLGIDLLVNKVDGMSLGLRYILDSNHAHAHELRSYYPPVTTRVFLAVSWSIALIAMVFQWYFYMYRQRRPFIRQVFQIKSTGSPPAPFEPDPDFASDYRLPNLPPGLSDEMSVSGDHWANARDVDRDSMQERYRLAVVDTPTPEPYIADSRGVSPLLPVETLRKIEAIQRHPRDLSHLDDPPSRPASVVSSTLAAGLKSRPPTFFDEPLRSPTFPAPPPLRRNPTPPFPSSTSPVDPPYTPATAEHPSTFVSHDVPVVVVAAPSPSTPTRRPSIPSSVPVGPLSEDGASVSPDSSNRVSSNDLTVGGQAHAAFAQGFQTGEMASLPATARTPSSGHDISTLLGGGRFSSPPAPPPVVEHTVDLAPPPTSAGRPSTETNRSFATTQDGDSTAEYSEQGFPSTPTSARAMTPLETAGVQEWKWPEKHKESADETEELR
ncbi:hypothetical protein JCM8097_006393 [Rhodosporidiobolus ruineniae]